MKNIIQKVKMTKNDIYEEEKHLNSFISVREIEFHDQKSSHNQNSRNQWLQ